MSSIVFKCLGFNGFIFIINEGLYNMKDIKQIYLLIDLFKP